VKPTYDPGPRLCLFPFSFFLFPFSFLPCPHARSARSISDPTGQSQPQKTRGQISPSTTISAAGRNSTPNPRIAVRSVIASSGLHRGSHRKTVTPHAKIPANAMP